MKSSFLVLILAALPAWPQTPLTLADAVRIALEKHPSIEASQARGAAAGTRIDQARGNYLPKVNYSESFARSNNPVFVFSSLLTQHQFTEQDFAIGPLNRPDFLNNFQSVVSVDQVVYDAGQIRHGVRSAELGRKLAAEDERLTRMSVIASVLRSYFGAALARESLAVANEAVKSAEADFQRAETVRAAGMATDADVLSIRVHLSAMKEQQIRRTYDLSVARAAVNEALGLPLDTDHDLSTSLAPVTLTAPGLDQFEKTAVAERPEARQAGLAAKLAETQAQAARSSLLPQVGVRAAFEADRQRFIDRGGANWLFAASLKWNLFNGFSDRARISEANESLRGARAGERHAAGGIRLQVRKAWADYKAAGERIEVAAAAVAMAEESLRIIKNRYEAGLATVTDLLRNETALMETRTRRLAAIYDQRVAAALLEMAAGTLAADSESVRNQ
jgi:outer membrane protein TolC